MTESQASSERELFAGLVAGGLADTLSVTVSTLVNDSDEDFSEGTYRHVVSIAVSGPSDFLLDGADAFGVEWDPANGDVPGQGQPAGLIGWLMGDDDSDLIIGHAVIYEFDLSNPAVLEEADAISADTVAVVGAVLDRYDERQGEWVFADAVPAAVTHFAAFGRLLVVDLVSLEPWARGCGVGPYAVTSAIGFLSRGVETVSALYARALPDNGDNQVDRDALDRATGHKVQRAWTLAGFEELPGQRVMIAT